MIYDSGLVWTGAELQPPKGFLVSSAPPHIHPSAAAILNWQNKGREDETRNSPPLPPSNGSQNTGPVMQPQTDCQTARQGLGTGAGRQRWEFASEQPPQWKSVSFRNAHFGAAQHLMCVSASAQCRGMRASPEDTDGGVRVPPAHACIHQSPGSEAERTGQ